MLKQVFNYYAMPAYEEELAENGLTLAGFCQELGVDGIEQFIYTAEDVPKDYAVCTIGAHLNYWPSWMALWLNDKKRLKEQFISVEAMQTYFQGARNRDEWLQVIRGNIAQAASQNAEYLVWHVAECTPEEAFTWDFRYDDARVLATAADLFNAVAASVPENICVLFENLWWPGLRLTDAALVREFFARIERKNVGIMLDTGHLLNTNPQLRTETEAADYVCRVCDALGADAERIKGVHLSCSLSGAYQRSLTRRKPETLDNATIWKHISSIDQHRPFTTKAARQILECVQPQYINHELAYATLADLRENLSMQLDNCR